MKINDKKGMFSKAIEDSAYKGTLQLHVEGVGDGVAPIRQSLTQVSAADSMKDDFVPIFWFEDESPTPPQIVSSTEGKEASIAISASMNDIFEILGNGQWYISGSSPGNVTIQVSLSSCNCDVEIHVTLLPLLSLESPNVAVGTADEQNVFESRKFKWRGSFSHLFDGKEQEMKPDWTVPSCSDKQTAAAFTPCPAFFAPNSPAIYADFEGLAKAPDPITLGDYSAKPIDSRKSSGNRSNTGTGNRTNTSEIIVVEDTFIVQRALSFKITSASSCSEAQRVVVIISVQNAKASVHNFPPTDGGDVGSIPDW